MKTLPAEACLLGANCGLCWTRRCERLGIKPLPPSEWGRLVGSHLKENRDENEEMSDPCVTQ